MQATNLIALDRYPVDDTTGEKGQGLVASCRQAMARTDCCRLPGFLSPAGLAAIRREADAVRDEAHHSDRLLTPYYRAPDPSLPGDDPRARTVRFAVGYVGKDRLEETGAVKSMFGWDPLLRLVENILDRGAIHRFDDSLGSLNVTVMRAGEELGWHFDACEAVVSLLLESAHAGGDFEFIPRFEGSAEHIRRQVSNVLEGDWSESVEVAMSSGDFVLFCGRHSLHRVTTIAGSGERLMLLMSFDNAAHRDDNVGNVNLFGRASA